MNTQLVAAQVRLQQWAEVVRMRSGSGLSVEEYCNRQGITTGQYYYWLRKIREATICQNAGAFVELTEPCSTEEKETDDKFAVQLTIRLNGGIIEVNEKTPPDLLADVIEVMKHA